MIEPQCATSDISLHVFQLKRIATLGDQLNDVLMFERSGLSIAMGNLLATIVECANVDKASAR